MHRRINRSKSVAVLLAGLMALSGVAQAQTYDPYGTDPLDLVALRDETRQYATGTDVWQVWVCDVPDGSVNITPAVAAATLNGTITPYFQALSASKYAPTFNAGGTVVASQPSGWPQDPRRLQSECEGLVSSQAGGTAAGAIIIVDASYRGGYATAGYPCTGFCPKTYPANSRFVVVGGGAVVSTNNPPAYSTVAHELGHALFWPHSYGGLFEFPTGVTYLYDNPMDVMSGPGDGLDIGTLAVNRYAAGWIGNEAMVFHRGGDLTYTLRATTGIQMLVLPTDITGVYEFLDVRVRSGIDTGIPAEGVEVYRVDQSDAVCAVTAVGECYGLDRRTAQIPAVAAYEAIDHVHGVGAVFLVRNMSITVLARNGSTFSIRVNGAAVAERFIDDNGNFHEQNIAAIAARGITRGCNPPLVDRFCPASNVTRAEMAAFLVAALGQSLPATHAGYFPDVPAGAWFSPYVELLKELGITTGYSDGTFGPDLPVSRAEMAAFLSRAFNLTAAAPGTSFGDVASNQWYAVFVEAIRVAGITSGCSTAPSLYCPLDPVKRDQMATFLARALKIGV